MSILVLVLESLFIVILDFKIHKTLYTPTIFLSVPFVVITLCAFCMTEKMGLLPIYLPSLYYWCIGLFLFWIVGVLISTLFSVRYDKVITSAFAFPVIAIPFQNNFFICLISLCALFIDIFTCQALAKNGFIISDHLGEELSTGLIAHCGLFLRYSSIASFILIKKQINWKNVFHLFILLSLMFYLLCLAVKGAVLITILAGTIGRLIIAKKTFKITYIIYLLLVAFFVFFVIYSFLFEEPAPIDFILTHIYFYFTSGIVGFSNYVKDGAPIALNFNLLFMPILNLYNKLNGIELQPVVSDIWTYVGDNKTSNVKTFFGTILIYGGYVGGIVTTIIWSMVCHLNFILAKSNNSFFFLNYLLLLAALLLGWFDCFFNMISYYEFMIYVIFFQIAFELKNR